MRVEDLIATQRRVTKAGVEKYLDDAGRVGRADKIRVYETHDGRRYIADGHHRAVAAWAAGVEVLPAVIQLVRENPTADLRSNPEAPAEGQTPDGLAWALEEGGEVPWKTDMEVDTFVRVTNRKGKTVCGVYADRHGDTLYVEYAVVFDPKLRRKGVYSDVLEGLSEHYNIVSDQDHNNAAASIYKRLGAQYSSRDERYTLRKKAE